MRAAQQQAIQSPVLGSTTDCWHAALRKRFLGSPCLGKTLYETGVKLGGIAPAAWSFGITWLHSQGPAPACAVTSNELLSGLPRRFNKGSLTTPNAKGKANPPEAGIKSIVVVPSVLNVMLVPSHGLVGHVDASQALLQRY
jgi:hypothetical protein